MPGIVLVVRDTALGDRVDRLHGDNSAAAVLARDDAIYAVRDDELEPWRPQAGAEFGPGGVVVVFLFRKGAGEAAMARDDVFDVRGE